MSFIPDSWLIICVTVHLLGADGVGTDYVVLQQETVALLQRALPLGSYR